MESRSNIKSQKAIAIIVAGGKGQRMGSAIPKQFIPVAGKPLLNYAINAFTKAIPEIKIVLVLPEEHISYANIILQHLEQRMDITLVTGGASRFESVKNGLKEVQDEAIVFVHDGVRPFITTELILNCYNQAKEKGSAIPCVPVKDSIRQVVQGQHVTVNRENLKAVQTPQTFIRELILPAFEQAYDPHFTDEATVVEANGTKVFLIDGEYTNIKITTQEDLLIANYLIEHPLN